MKPWAIEWVFSPGHETDLVYQKSSREDREEWKQLTANHVQRTPHFDGPQSKDSRADVWILIVAEAEALAP